MLSYEETCIFLKYKKALVAIGIDLANEEVTDLIESCNYDLEARFQAIVSYWYWLQTQEREIIEPNQLLIKAFYQQWKPIGWKDEYLLNENFKTPAEKWWSKASQVDIIKNLIIDVVDNFWSGGKIIFNHPYGEPWTMDLDIAMDMSWQQIIAHYQRVTKTVIESHLGRLVFRQEE
ncbi:MAG: hypothetical protein QNJ34_20460 [Xenococcaceae cyanobacterium MO_188.B29]|nr:hypothetical protein [Xenococcaceae cyanobacterium MO_188.B29]